MNILFVGTLVDKKKIHNYSGSSVAGNKMQLGIAKNLFIENKKKLSILSVEPYQQSRVFDRRKKIIFQSNSKLENIISAKNIFFINIILIKQISIFFSLLFNIMKWIFSNKKSEKIIIVYNSVSFFAGPVLILTKILNIKSLVIVADVPINSNKKLLSKIEDKIEILLIRFFDLIVPLTKYISSDFADNKKNIVIEAGVDIKDYKIEKLEKKEQNINDKYIVLFSGTLNELSGIEVVIEAFNLINDDSIELHIYGEGPCKKQLEKLVKNSQILFLGQKRNEDILKLQKHADLLVSPRLPDDFVTKYTFPSKILEYIASGNPVLSNKLLGIPDEYYEYIYVSKGIDALNWKNAILKIKNEKKEIINYKTEKAQQFILKNKSWEKQSMKIFNFIKENI